MGRRSKKNEPAIDDEGSPSAMLPVVDLSGLVLIALRWFTPTEGTFRGDTLWISQLWLAWGALAAWSALRQQDRWTRRGGLWTWGLALLTAGHLIGGLAVVLTEGQKRAALNGMWEWVSLGVAAVWFHHRASCRSFRRTFRIVLIASAVGLSALGIWQRWISQPALGRAVVEFDELESKLPTLEGVDRRAAESRLRKLSETIGWDYRQMDPQGRRGLRQRLLESSEPLGRFALANSLSAVLLVALCLVAGETVIVWRGRAAAMPVDSGRGWGGYGLAMASVLIAFVLLLTKSRTAWCGGLAGGSAALLLGDRGLRMKLIAGGLAATGLLVLATWAAGGLDQQVVTEAKKSLSYRTEYWIGTWRVIQEHPLFGVGPGNFRQHYLAHKLAKSSEEVLDPHNFLLEAWVTGGLLAIAGLAAVIVAACTAWRRAITPEPAMGRDAWRSSAPAILVISGVVLGVFALLFEGYADWELGATLGVALLAAIGLNRVVPTAEPSGGTCTETATQAAWLGLSVHLLGAGGMEMPAIIQLWLCLSSLIVAARAAAVRPGIDVWPGWMPGATLAMLLLAAVGGVTSTRHSSTSRALVNLAHADAAAGVRLERIDERLKQAAEADAFDPEPWRTRAQLAFAEWDRTHESEWFERAIESQRELIARDPAHSHNARELAEMFSRRFEFDGRPEDAEAAVEASRRALDLYPNSLRARMTYAVALQAAGKTDEAQQAARAAVELDNLWRELGHFDKTLSTEDRERMKDLAAEGM